MSSIDDALNLFSGSDEAAGADTAVESSSSAAPVTSTSSLFKKKGAKRKPDAFRAPAASLQDREGGSAKADTAAASSTASTSAAVSTAAVPASSSAAAADASSSSVTQQPEQKNDKMDDSDSDNDDDDTNAGRSIRLSAAELASAHAAAAEVDTSDPEQDEEDPSGEAGDGEGGVNRPSKKAKKENPLAQSTRARLSKETLGLHIESTRSALPDMRTADKQITMDITRDPKDMPKKDPNKSKWSGPQKPQASNVRMISRFDYQPDVCKDYKETGYCGFGDSCKFLHDRSDYKQGWQLERDWNKEQEEKLKKKLAGESVDDDSADTAKNKKDAKGEDLPWACPICRQEFKNPVVTKCKHYFCENCALNAYVKDTKCTVCRAQTSGIFNAAPEITAAAKKRTASGRDPRAELEKLERERNADQENRQTGAQ